jgi:hypothetical protein
LEDPGEEILQNYALIEQARDLSLCGASPSDIAKCFRGQGVNLSTEQFADVITGMQELLLEDTSQMSSKEQRDLLRVWHIQSRRRLIAQQSAANDYAGAARTLADLAQLEDVYPVKRSQVDDSGMHHAITLLKARLSQVSVNRLQPHQPKISHSENPIEGDTK